MVLYEGCIQEVNLPAVHLQAHDPFLKLFLASKMLSKLAMRAAIAFVLIGNPLPTLPAGLPKPLHLSAVELAVTRLLQKVCWNCIHQVPYMSLSRQRELALGYATCMCNCKDQFIDCHIQMKLKWVIYERRENFTHLIYSDWQHKWCWSSQLQSN